MLLQTNLAWLIKLQGRIQSCLLTPRVQFPRVFGPLVIVHVEWGGGDGVVKSILASEFSDATVEIGGRLIPTSQTTYHVYSDDVQKRTCIDKI